PYYVTGALTASGGAWNASIVAEIVKWGDTTLKAKGVGAYIAQATTDGDYPRVVLGITAMSIFVIVFNRLVWRKLYAFAAERTRLD
ncbi:MAG: sulfonate ABC transporter permease, partial [Hyphomicrobiales bacterium]|nr:sulfonate ABC transporter permease [Hyphomicrobiales bacterium]